MSSFLHAVNRTWAWELCGLSTLSAADHTSLCLVSPLCQQTSESVWVVHPYLWTFLYERWRRVFLSTKVFCSKDQLIRQSLELFEICFSYCQILYQSEFFPVVFLENFEFHIQLVGIIFGLKSRSNLYWPLPNFTELVQLSLSKEAVVL